MSEYGEIKIEDVQVGDVVTVVGRSVLFQNLRVTKIEQDGGFDTGTYGFDPTWGWRYFLIERPKSLPTKLGSVVKASGVEWVLCDPGNADSWFSSEDQSWRSTKEFSGEDWEEVV